MITIEEVTSLLSRMVVASQIEDGIRISTHVLYPSNDAVTVTVRGGTNSFVISDEGGAVGALVSAGVRAVAPDRMIRAQIKNHGLHVQDGIIYSPRVPLKAIPAAILLVANGSRSAADWGLSHLRFRPPRNFREDLSSLLNRYFHDNLKHDTPVIGASNKPHKFVHVAYLSGQRRLLIDPVVNDASSINARLVSNLDVRMANDPLIEQLIVFDDRQRWNSSDLKLLELGAPTVAFSHVEPEIRRRAI